MTLDEYNQYCASLQSTAHVVQWGGAHVWKVGGKVFAVAGWSDEQVNGPYITFKCSEISYDILKEQPGCRPAPYLASRGMKWIQIQDHEEFGDETIRQYIEASYRMAIERLTKKMKRELEL